MSDLNTILELIGDGETALADDNLQEAQRHLQQARSLIQQHRDNDQVTGELRQAVAWFNTVERQFRSKRGDRIHELDNRLEQMLQETDPGDFDEAAANRLLRKMRQLDVQDSYSDIIQKRQAGINQKTFSAGAVRRIDEIIEQVESLWAEADEQRQQERTADPTFFMNNYYNKAERIAEEALSEYPDNARLASLKQEATRRRGQEAIAAQVYTSALKEDQYRKALDDLEQLAGSQTTIPRYALSEIEPGRKEERYTGEVSIEEAREEILQKARQWASQKALEYRTEAQQQLRMNKPWAAREILKGKANIDTFLTDFDDRQKLQNLEEEVDAKMLVVERAQTKAREALDALDEAKADTTLRAAWMLYQEAQRIHPNAPGHEEARKTIVERMREQLLLRLEEARQLARSHQSEDLDVLVSDTNRQFGDVNEPRIDDLLQQLNAVREEEQQYQDDLRQAKRTYEEARRLADMSGGAQQAVALIEELKEAPEAIRSQLDEFEVVEARVLGKFQLAQQIRQLEDALDSTRLTETQRALRAIEELNAQHPGNATVQDVRANLQLHQNFLLAQQEKQLGDLEEARNLLQDVSQARTHPDAVRARNLLSEIERDLKEAGKIQQKLDTLARQISGNPAQAFRDLNALNAKTTGLREQQTRLIEEAEKAWYQEIDERLEQTEQAWYRHLNSRTLTADDRRMLRLEQVTRDLDTLRDTLNRVADYDRWQRRLSLFLAVKRAQQERAKGDDESLQQAIQYWQDAIQIAGADYPDTLPAYRDALRETRKERVFAIVQRSMVGLSAGETRQIGEATRARHLLQELAREFPEDVAIALQQSRLALHLAQVSDSAGDREQYYQEILGAVERVHRSSSSQPELIRFSDLAERGQQLSRQMQTIERQFNSRSISEVARAKVIWEEDIRQHAHGEFSTLKSWWQDKTTSLLKSVEDTGYQQTTRVDDLRPLAIRYIIDPENYEASSSMQDLPGIVARLNRDVRRELQTVKTAERHTGTSGMERLEKQTGAFNEFIKQLSLVNEIPRAFKALRRINLVPSDRIQQEVEQVADTVNANLDSLRDRLDDLRDLEDQLQAVQTSLPMEAGKGDFSNSGVILEQNLEFESHPAYRDVARQRQLLMEQRDTVQQQLDTLQSALDAGDFVTARQITDKLSLEVLQKFNLDRDLRLTINGQVVTDWLQAVARITGQEDIYTQFDRYATRLLETVQGLNPAEVMRDVDTLLATGAFAEACDLLKEAIKGDAESGKFRGRLALQPHLNELEAPLAKMGIDSPDDGAMSSDEQYSYLENQLPAETGRIRQLREQLDRVRDQLEQMHAKQTVVDDYKSLWDQLWQTWTEGLKQIATSLQEAGGLQASPRQAQRENLKRAVERMQQAHNQALEKFPRHPRLLNNEMGEGLYLYQQALRVT